jgi:c-di-GMP-binding flagellar brake protein YcgR
VDHLQGEERREFIRTKAELTVKYKFIAPYRQDIELLEIYDGKTRNISSTGLLLEGRIPNFDWLSEMLMFKMVIGVNIFLPGDPTPLKVLCRSVWLEAIDEKTLICRMGLMFKEITKEHQDRITRYVIHCQMP